MQNHYNNNGVSRRKFIGTLTGAAALSLLKLDRRAIAGSLPLDGLLTDYTGRICYNENPLGPSAAAITAIQEEAAMSHRYPDWYADSLVSDLASFFDIDSDKIVCGSGATEILRLSAMAFAESGGNVVSSYPSYSQFPNDAEFFGSDVRYADLDDDYLVDLTALYNLVDGDTTCVCITNPNNPTGTLLNPEDLSAFVDSLPSGVVTLIDEAYVEIIRTTSFTPDSIWEDDYLSAVEMVKDGKNVVVVRTFSKGYGLAGARIGYAIGRESRINSIKANRIFATVSRASLEAAKAALEDQDHIRNTAVLARQTRQYCYNEFDDMGLDYIPSAVNFFMVDVGNADSVRSQLSSRGIYVRSGWGMPGHLRVSTGTMHEMESFINALRDILGYPGGRPKKADWKLPENTELFQAYPNPFNSSTSIKVFLPATQKVSLEIYNVRGRLVTKLADRVLGAGEHAFVWNGIDSSGKSVSSGSYFYRLVAGEDVITRRMILIK
ncbi:MAG: aminotransferase class I/II-fold pyridoxal phosphate-dependent enzyme [candidate division Zixibacteria bacterium]|nr:aminotransferase class I/II-fold pyridoxal phosphate-dependent enzyme [candidate division Zixibacteria bacterium]